MKPLAMPFTVCEKTGLWAAAIRWQPGSRSLAIKEVRSLIEARTILLQFPTSIAALEATSTTAEGVLRLLLELQRVGPQSYCIVLLTEETQYLANLFTEAGAAYVAHTQRRLDRVVRLAERHLASQERPELTTRERIWARLPWGGDET